MLNFTKAVGIALSLLSIPSLACDIEGKTGFMPDNDMYISASEKSSNGMDQTRFNQIIDRAIEFYTPIIAEKGAKLKVERKWTDGTVNAYARQDGKTWSVFMFGGLARHQDVTPDGFALVLCHELGHHLAGAPKKKMFLFKTWASNEGQSDYWAAAKCFRRIYESDNNDEIVESMDIDPEVEKKCNAVWSNKADLDMCKRISQASKGLAKLLNGGREVSFTTPDKTVVSKTDHNHPKGQCRLDTYFNGALCDKDFNEEVSNSDAKVGVCNRSESYDIGVRPLCWYKPSR